MVHVGEIVTYRVDIGGIGTPAHALTSVYSFNVTDPAQLCVPLQPQEQVNGAPVALV